MNQKFVHHYFLRLQTLFVQITRTRHEVASIRRQVDVAKLRLTTDIKVC